MNKKHLFWIIPVIIVAYLFSLFFSLVVGSVVVYDVYETKYNWLNVYTPNCWDGCLYAEWYINGYQNLNKSSNLYNECTNACYVGDEYFKSKD